MSNMIYNYGTESITRSLRFSANIWKQTVRDMGKVFSLSEKESGKLENNPVAKLIAALPYLAGCKNPDRTSYSHLSSYITAVRTKHISSARTGDTLFERMFDIFQFNGGNPEILKKGICLLMYASLHSYHMSREYDLENKEFNPLNSGDLNYELEKKRLLEMLDIPDTPELDEFLTVNGIDVLPRAFWGI